MIDRFSDFADFFENSKFPKKELSTNFFSIGTRGFYENPFTDILSYILDKKTEYNYRNEFIKILLEKHINNDIIESIVSEGKIQKQHSTINGNYIDFIIYNNEYILVFENKINHWLANPFEDYIFDINTKYQNLQKFFIIFSYHKVTCPENWININIKQTFQFLKESLPHKFDNKWDYFVNDFLIQFSDNNKIVMDPKEFEFFSKYFNKIIEANENLNEYFISIGENFKQNEKLASYRISNNWSKFDRAIRLYPFNNDNNVTLIFNNVGEFSVSIYYYKDFTDFHLEINNHIGIGEYRIWKEGNIICSTRLPGKEFKKIEDAITECQNQIEKMKKYYG